MGPIVSTEWLAAEIGQPDLVVFDATKYLPNENRNARAEFLAARIPGARFFDIDEVADQDTDLPHMVPSVGRFEKLMGRFGITKSTRVVFYDQKGIASSARGWWLMGLFGHDAVAVLNGGFPKWMSDGRMTDSGEPIVPTETTYTASLRARRLRGIGDMLTNLETKAEIVHRCAECGAFFRYATGAAQGTAIRSHSRRGQSSVYRTAWPRWNISSRQCITRTFYPSGSGREQACRDELRNGCDGVYLDAGNVTSGFAARCRLRWLLDRMGNSVGHAH
jgi:rhodanese-related sulfurtransferase